MSISKKLGIKPIERYKPHSLVRSDEQYEIVVRRDLEELEQQNNDMLELLVEEAKEHLNASKEYGIRFKHHTRHKDYFYLVLEIAKIYKKTPEEIKRLIE